MADIKASNHPHATIATYGLGSCLGVTCYDPAKRIGGLLHAMLPTATKYLEPSTVAAMYLDTGLGALFQAMLQFGSDPRHCEFKVFGGAQILRACEYFKIGQQNVAIMRALAVEHRLHVPVWEVGGQANRSITLHLETGHVLLRMPTRNPILR